MLFLLFGYLLLLQYYEVSNQAVSSLQHVKNNMENESDHTLTMKISYRSPSSCFNQQLDVFPCMVVLHVLTMYV